MSTRSRRFKWHPTPPPPSPKIINLPRRHSTRRRKPRTNVDKQPISGTTGAGMIQTYNFKGKLESLFGVEREFKPDTERRERVEAEEVVEEDDGGGDNRLSEEKWRFQAEILRAECNFLRMERKFALKKLEKNRVRIEKTLKSALQNLASGRKKLCEGKNMELVLEDEMKELAETLEELQTSYNGGEDLELQKCKNFDKKASRLQRRLNKLGRLTEDECKNKIKNVATFHTQSNGEKVNENSSILDQKTQPKSTDVEMLERKMEGLSKGVLDMIMEKEYGSIINSSASSSKRIDFPDHVSFSNRFTNYSKEPLEGGKNKCSGRCKVLVRRVVEQVRAETEQWSQMQEMLGQLRQEMEELQTSKDFWEAQALASNDQIQSLQSDVEEWREKAFGYETKANKLETEVVLLKGELEKLKKDERKEVSTTPKKTILSLGKQIEKETKIGLSCRMKQCDVIDNSKRHEKVEQSKKDSQPLSLGKQLAREKRILVSKMKENNEGRRRKGHYGNLVRSPFKDIGNSSSNSNAVFPLHWPEPARMEERS